MEGGGAFFSTIAMSLGLTHVTIVWVGIQPVPTTPWMTGQVDIFIFFRPILFDVFYMTYICMYVVKSIFLCQLCFFKAIWPEERLHLRRMEFPKNILLCVLNTVIKIDMGLNSVVKRVNYSGHSRNAQI